VLLNDVQSLAKKAGVEFHSGGATKSHRVMEKSRLAYKGDFARLKDYRRASVVCPDIPFIIKFVAAIENNPKLLVCRHKNRFDKSYPRKSQAGICS